MLNELVSFNSAGEELFKAPSPIQQHRLQQTLLALQETDQRRQQQDICSNYVPIMSGVSETDSADPENEIPSLAAVETDVMAAFNIAGFAQKCQ